MKIRWSPWSALELFFLGIVTWTWGVSTYGAKLVYSNDVWGEVEPCGCRKDPKGGFLRKLNLIKKLGAEPVLQLDAGDAFFSARQIPDVLLAQSKVQAAFVVRSMNILKHDVYVPGERDFAAGFSFFEQLRAQAKFKILAANLKKKDGNRFLESQAIFTLKERGMALRVGVIGVVSPSLDWPRELVASSPVQAVREAIVRMRPAVDRILVLSHMGLEADRKLAHTVRGIDLIVGGHTNSFLQQPEKIQGTWIVQSSFRNQYIGLWSLPPVGKKWDVVHHELLGLDVAYDQPNEMTVVVDEFKKAVAKINSDEDAKRFSSIPENQKMAFQTFPKCAECHLAQFDFWRKTRHANALEVLARSGQLKNKECLGCHTVGLGHPQGFNSVNSVAFLGPKADLTGKDSSNEADYEPTPYLIDDLMVMLKQMHQGATLDTAIRVGDTQAPIREGIARLERSWAPVQCENCHGPGGNHPFTPGYSRRVSSGVCLRCHTPQQAHQWYLPGGKLNEAVIAGKLKSMTCPAGEGL